VLGIVASAALLYATTSEAAPPQSHDIASLASQWLGMTVAQFEQANQLNPAYTNITKSKTPTGHDLFTLVAPPAPALKSIQPSSLQMYSYEFDESGHLFMLTGLVARGYTPDTASDQLTAEYGPAIVRTNTAGYPETLWSANGVVVEMSATMVIVYRPSQRCLDAMKAATPDPKALEGCGPPQTATRSGS
jgi:hypothetical protein